MKTYKKNRKIKQFILLHQIIIVKWQKAFKTKNEKKFCTHKQKDLKIRILLKFSF